MADFEVLINDIYETDNQLWEICNCFKKLIMFTFDVHFKDIGKENKAWKPEIKLYFHNIPLELACLFQIICSNSVMKVNYYIFLF